jgi:predicted AlkP superfamily phosphohydrolase/phosphomutase
MSDHGFGELRSDVCLNRVLADAGLLTFLPRPKGGGPGDYVKKFARTHLSADNRKKINRFLGKDDFGQRWNVFVDSLVADIDWSRTKIFGVAQHGCLYLNIKGRDPMGIVEETDRLAVLEEAERALLQLKDPLDGEPVVTGFYRKEDIYNGPLIDSMPDMVINMRGWSYRGISSTGIELAKEEIFRPQAQEWGELGHSGTHRREGILIMHGPNISAGRFPEAEMVDIAPTIMALLGLPAGQEMDGKVLDSSLTNMPETQPAGEQKPEHGAPEPEHTYSAEDEQEIRKRLENLGYL